MWPSVSSIKHAAFALTAFLAFTSDSRADAQRNLRRLSDLPSLRLHVTTKKSSLAVQGQTQFDVLANPVVASDGSVLYDAIATFNTDGVTYKYILSDGQAYYTEESETNSTQTAECLSTSAIPSISDLLAAIDAATPIAFTPSSSTSNLQCATGSLSLITLAGVNYGLCVESTGFTIYGADLDIEASYLSTSVTITPPSIICSAVETSTAVSSNTLAILTGTTTSNATTTRVLESEEADVEEATCTCKGTARPCIFFHGLGVETETGIQTTSDYFGDVSSRAPCCSSIKYAVLNTVDYAWTDSTLQQKVCTYAASVSSTSTSTTIKNTIIVAHSMGNLMLAGALANGKCTLDSTTSWVALSGPMKGSMGSDYLQSTCAGGGLLAAIADLVGGCPANTATISMAYEGGSYASSALNTAYAAAQAAYQKYVSAAICSNAYTGIFSTDQAVYALAGSIIPHKSSQNDGVVEYQSCAGGLSTSKFGSTYTSTFYVTSLNHADTAFRHGDSSTSTARMPVKWFECLL